MENKCPICGAPMEGGVCDYCGYKDEKAESQGMDINNMFQDMKDNAFNQGFFKQNSFNQAPFDQSLFNQTLPNGANVVTRTTVTTTRTTGNTTSNMVGNTTTTNTTTNVTGGPAGGMMGNVMGNFTGSPMGNPMAGPMNNTINNFTGGFTPSVSSKSRLTAVLLCIFFGELGVHRFYVGKVGTGLLYLFTFGIFGIGWLVDLILLACGSFKDRYGLPLK